MKLLNPPLRIFILTLCLVSIGIVSVYSASASFHYMTRQVLYASLGLVCMVVCYSIDYQWFKRVSFWLMIIALVLCVLVFVPGIGWANKRNAHRWINLRFALFQPSEFARLALVIYMAKMLADRRQFLTSFWKGVFPAMVIAGVFAAIIVVEPDYGAAAVLCAGIFGMWLAAGMRWFHLLGLVTASLPAAAFAFLLKSYRMRRLMAFLYSDEQTVKGVGYQLHQSLISVGSGGLWGLGLGHSMQKYHFPTEAHTDFIFALMCEEFGYVRISIFLLIYGLLVLQGWLVALRTTDLFGSLLAAGITLMIFIAASVHMGVVLGLLPTKGLVLPFISYGGSSLIVNMAAIGILMNVARNQFAHNADAWNED